MTSNRSRPGTALDTLDAMNKKGSPWLVHGQTSVGVPPPPPTASTSTTHILLPSFSHCIQRKGANFSPDHGWRDAVNGDGGESSPERGFSGRRRRRERRTKEGSGAWSWYIGPWLGVDSVNNRVQLGYGLGIFVLYGILYSLVKVDNWGPKFYLD